MVSSNPETNENLALWFTPEAIRSHFEGDDDEVSRAVEAATDDQLVRVGEACLCADTLYEEFHRLLTAVVEDVLL